MRTVSLVTPVYGESASFLPATYESLQSQALPDGWNWEWLLQEDGSTGIIESSLGNLIDSDQRIKIAHGRHGGAGITRTLALGRATGELTKVLDADDLLPPGTLARDIAVLTEHDEVGWTTSRVLDLLPDGTTEGFDLDPPAGELPRGAVYAHWAQHSFRPQVHPATLCMRTDLVLAVGGWMALPASEDTGLLLALSAVSPGWFIPDVGLLYRKWPGQSTQGAAYLDQEEKHARMAVIGRRAEALARFFPA